MQETVYNLFLFVDEDGLIRFLGAVAHPSRGDDESKLRLLQNAVAADISRARRFPVTPQFIAYAGDPAKPTQNPATISMEFYRSLCRTGEQLDLFEEVFRELDAPPDPLVCITPVFHGAPLVEAVERFGVGPLV